MNFLKQQIGWILFGATFVAGIALLLSAPRSITIPDRPQPHESTRAAQETQKMAPPHDLRPLLEADLSPTLQNTFRPPERWSTMTPQNPPKPPLPKLTLPNPTFVLPLPPARGIRWSPLFPEIKQSGNTSSQVQSTLKTLASNISSSNRPRNDTKRSLIEGIEPFDKVYLEEQKKWVKGAITDESNNFITFRFLASGQIKRFNLDQVKLKRADNPVESFRKTLQNQQEITEEQELNTLVDQATRLGLYTEAADLVKQFAKTDLASNDLYRRAAELYRQGGAPHKAVEVLQSALNEKNTNKHELLYLIARHQWELGLRERALDSLQESIDLRPLFMKARLLRFLYMYDLGNPSKTATELKKMKSEISGMPSSKPEVKLYHFARILHQWSYKNRSLKQFSMDKLPTASDISDSYSFAWSRAIALRSRLLLAKGNTAKAISTLASGLQKLKTSYPLWYNLGVIGLATNQQNLTRISFSACNQIAPHRIEHRLAQSNASGKTNSSSALNAVLSENHKFLLSYHRALTSLNENKKTASDSTENENTVGSEENPFSNGTDSGSSDPETDSPFADNSDSENGDTSSNDQDNPFGPSGGNDGRTDGSSADSNPAVDSGVGNSRSKQTTRDLFEQVYRENPAFNPGALGLSYQFMKEGQTNKALPLLEHHVPDSWMKHFLVGYALAMEEQYESALQYIKNHLDDSEDNNKTAYKNALTAYLQLKLGRTKQASNAINTSSNNQEVSTYVKQLNKRIEQSRNRRVLEETFERTGSGSEEETFIGIGWTSTPGNSGMSIQRQDGRVTFSGTLNRNDAFPRISRPTSGQFISAEFSGQVPSESNKLYVGAGLMDTSGTQPEPLLLVAIHPKNPKQNTFVHSGSFPSLGDWTKHGDTTSGPNEGKKADNGSFHIRIKRNNTSAEANWSVEINDQTMQLNTFSPGQFNSSKRSVVFFVTGPKGTSARVQLDHFRLVHQLNR